jgi:hypothetical protein
VRFPDTIDVDDRPRWLSMLTAESRTVRGRVRVLDRDEAFLGVDLPVVGGSVSVNATADVTRTADVVALDVDDALGFEAASPWAGAVFADKFVQIDYGVVDPLDGTTHWTPIFRGSVTSFERTRPEIRLGAQGKEALMLAPNLPLFRGSAMDVARTTRVDDAVERIARRAGERLFDLPWTTNRRLQRRIELGRTSEPWRAIRAIAKDAGMVAFYAGDGRLTMRPKQTTPVVTFGDDLLLSWPRLTYDLGSDFRNTVLVVGEAAGKQDRRPLAWAMASASDPLGPDKLSRNGAPRYIAEYVKVDATAKPKVNRIADDEFDRRMKQAVNVDFSSLPVPGLEEWDPAKVQPPGEDPYPFVVTTFGLDLAAGAMEMGSARTVRVPKVARA